MALQEEMENQGVWLFRYRGVLPLIILLIGGLLYVNSKVNSVHNFLDNDQYEIYFEIACLLVSFIGLGIRIYTVGHTPKNTSGRNVTEQVADRLNTTGIYSMVRHPLYLGNFFMWLGPALLTANWWFVVSFCFFYWIYYERIMYAEEQFLRRKFVEQFTSWAQKTPAFIPNLSNFTNSDLDFSWKKVLIKEKNGLAATLIIFFAFDIAGEYLAGTTNYNYFIAILFALSIILFAILKFLQKNTKILHEEGR